ncbi:glycogenin-1-like isoform X2 [Lethenteron reissneri]|uniref:glycogenin-1-like isoform X2 n=1 Tax=Lethenteron reissneri TaxID=7753 RepID=UPI002AB71D1F|nr:glycogenin-1-like isoform X2 [Lethenteron reissneri]
MADEAFVTLATNDSYAKGALVLAHSLRQQGTTRQLVILVTPHVSAAYRSALGVAYDLVQPVDVMDSGDAAHLALMERPELGVTLTKIHCWALTQYTKAVFMDADTLAVAPLDDLFEREELSAAPDPGWPDCFNSGLFVFRPSLDTYAQLLELARSTGSFDGGDQGLLNTFFSGWATENIDRHLPFTYNLSIASVYSYLPAYKRFGGDVKVVHFLGAVKPWHCRYDSTSGTVSSSSSDLTQQHQQQQQLPHQLPHHANFLQRWWQLFHASVLPTLPADAAAAAVAQAAAGVEVGGDAGGGAGDGAGGGGGVDGVGGGGGGGVGGGSAAGEVSSLQSALSALAVAPGAGSSQQEQQQQQQQQEHEERRRRQQWESGQADYLGADAFKHIQRKLDSQLK